MNPVVKRIFPGMVNLFNTTPPPFFKILPYNLTIFSQIFPFKFPLKKDTYASASVPPFSLHYIHRNQVLHAYPDEPLIAALKHQIPVPFIQIMNRTRLHFTFPFQFIPYFHPQGKVVLHGIADPLLHLAQGEDVDFRLRIALEYLPYIPQFLDVLREHERRPFDFPSVSYHFNHLCPLL